MADHGLTLGALTLTGDQAFSDPEHGFWFEVAAQGTNFGSAEAVTSVVLSLLSDGDLVSYDRDGNRSVPLKVLVKGADLASVAQGEAALRRELRKRNTLTWQAPDYFAVPTAFDVVTSWMEHEFDDLGELLRRQRLFSVTLVCAPHASSVDLTTVAALAPPPVSPTTATITNADTTTGWSAFAQGEFVGGAFPDVSPAVVDIGDGVSASAECINLSLLYTPASPVALTGTPFLVLEMSGNAPDSVSVGYLGGPTTFPLAHLVRTLSSGRTRYYFPVDPSRSLQSLSIFWAHNSSPASVVTFNVFDVSRTDTPENVSPREMSRIIEVGGTERAPASLHASTISGFLGQTVIHTTPYVGSGYSPDMRRWRSSGNSTSANADARKITGTWELMRPNPVVSRTPAHSMPRGDYILMAAIKSDTVGMHAIDYAVKSVTSGQTLGSTEDTYHHYFAVAHEMNLVPLAALAAPVVRSGALDVEVHLLNPSASVALSLEQWWMFTDGDDSALSVVGTSEGNLWLDSPDVNESVPTVWVGPSKAYGYHPGNGLGSQGRHTFRPGQLLVTSISDSNDYLEVEMAYRKRWHSNAAE